MKQKQYQYRINDAKTGNIGEDRFRWVDCEIIKGDLEKLTNSNADNYGVKVSYVRAYWDNETQSIYEKKTEDYCYYKKNLREKL